MYTKILQSKDLFCCSKHSCSTLETNTVFRYYAEVKNGYLLDFLVGELLPGVEHEKNHHLVGVDTQNVLLRVPDQIQHSVNSILLHTVALAC